MPYRPPFPIPEDIDAETFCLCLKVPNDPIWKAALAGLLDEMNQWYNWQRDDFQSGKRAAHRWRVLYNQIDWSTMSCCCPQIVNISFDENGTMIVTYSDGSTATGSETGDDPRSTSPELPPLPTTGSGFDNRCRSATNAVTGVHDAVELFGGELGTVGSIIALAGAIALAIVGVFAIPPSATVLIPIVIGLAQAIFSIASGTYLALFTDDTYNDLQCIFYCHCETDGSFTQSGYLAILSDISSSGFDSNVDLTFLSVLRGWSLAGLQAAARGGSLETGDCSDCVGCLECVQKWEVWGGAHGTITEVTDEYVEVEASDGGNGNYYVILRTSDENVCCYVENWEFPIGGASLHGWTDCGVTPTVGAPQHTGLGFGTCINYFQAQDAAPFTIRIFFVDCG
jgi:hypothetical protein